MYSTDGVCCCSRPAASALSSATQQKPALVNWAYGSCREIDIHVVVQTLSTGCTSEVSRGEKMLYSGTDPESYITEYALVYED